MKYESKDDACGLDLPNNQNPKPRAPIHYGPQYVPHPCNYKAEQVDHAKVMRQVNEAK